MFMGHDANLHQAVIVVCLDNTPVCENKNMMILLMLAMPLCNPGQTLSQTCVAINALIIESRS